MRFYSDNKLGLKDNQEVTVWLASCSFTFSGSTATGSSAAIVSSVSFNHFSMSSRPFWNASTRSFVENIDLVRSSTSEHRDLHFSSTSSETVSTFGASSSDTSFFRLSPVCLCALTSAALSAIACCNSYKTNKYFDLAFIQFKKRKGERERHEQHCERKRGYLSEKIKSGFTNHFRV